MHSRKRTITATIIAAALMLGSASCTKDATATNSGANAQGVSLFGTDGIMSNSFGDTVKNAGQLNGLSGTSALNPPDPTFDGNLVKINSSLDDFSYAGQAYDAVIITALAAQMAGSTNGADIAKYIDTVTERHIGSVMCNSFAACRDALANGSDITYRGVTVTNGFTKAGEPSTASYGTLHFGADNHIDVHKTEFINAGDAATASSQVTPAAKLARSYRGPALNLGVLLPKTGPLAAQGKPIIAGAEWGIAQLNDAGGVLGKPVVTEFADDGTDPNKAVAGARKLISEGANAIIGPSFSGASDAVIPIAAQAGVVLFSPSATAAALSTVNDHGMFFRTAPSDILQSQAIADIITRSGAQRVFIVARSDSYGTPFAHDVKAALAQDGVPLGNITTAGYSIDTKADNTTTYAQIATSIKSFHANAVLLIGYEEIGGMIAAMAHSGLTFNVA
jgi:ABC-type branched-subunit amino acid transport system substrate-binding protein